MVVKWFSLLSKHALLVSKVELPIIAKVPKMLIIEPLWTVNRPKSTSVIETKDKIFEIGGFEPFNKNNKNIPKPWIFGTAGQFM